MEDKKSPKGGGRFAFNQYWIYAIIAIVVILANVYNQSGASQEITINNLETFLDKGHIEKIEVINKLQAEVYIITDSLELAEYEGIGRTAFNTVNTGPHFYISDIGTPEVFEAKISEMQIASEKPLSVQYKQRHNVFAWILSWILPLLIIVALWLFLARRMTGGGVGGGSQIFNIGKSKAQLFDGETSVNISFKDVAGLDEAKEEVMEVVDFLKTPKKYTVLGGKIPKGVLLVGPPGTGKTLLAKAVAGEAGVPFFSLSGSDFVEMFVGVGASRVRDLFKQARDKAPCIIFVDEIDAIGRARGRNAMQGNDERENTLNQLLVEMDGFNTDKGVILMAATNRPDILDSALLRPGRFDRQISIDRPDLVGREQIFHVHLKNITLNPEVDAKQLAMQTPGFVGADIANICNEAALVAARKGKKSVDMEDFNHALDRVIGGLEKKNKLISPDEKRVIAYHEAGHAICGWFLEYGHPLVKVTIVPRGMAALGFAQYLPKEKYLQTKEEILDNMCVTLGGRAAEDIIFNRISTGASNDLMQVTRMGYAMIAHYGMSEKVGNVSFHDPQGNNQFTKPYSEATGSMIDEEVRKLASAQYERAKQLLTDKRSELEALAQELLNKEVLHREDVERIVGKRPFSDASGEQDAEEQIVDSEAES